MLHGLADLLVVDLSRGIAGGYTTKLLTDAGADVVLVEPPAGHPLRSWSATGSSLDGRDGALFQYLHAGQRSVVADPTDPVVAALLAGADLVVDDADDPLLDPDALRAAHPHLVVLSITSYGLTGPYRGRPATEFIVQAECGSVGCRGRQDQPPVQAGGRVSDWTAGAYAAPGALAAVLRARRTGRGAHVDCSVADVMAIAASTFSDTMHSMNGRPELTTAPRSIEVPSIEPTSDGWVGFNTNTGQQFESFLVLIEQPEELISGRWNTLGARYAAVDEWNALVRSWTTRHTTAEVVERASALRIPVAGVCDGASVLEHEHLTARGVFVDNPGGFRQPRPPYLVNGESPRPIRPAPRLGEHTASVSPPPPRDGAGPAGPTPGSWVGGGPSTDPDALPFAGLRILDLTSWWAGPSGTAVYAALGAEVIHVESTTHPDGMRLTGAMFGRDDWWEWGHMFAAVNVDKQGITLDLRHPEGFELCRQLIAASDAIVENFSPRVVEGWGLDWDAVHAINPRAVMVRMPAFGLSGPWRDRVGFAQTMEQMTGMAWITGHRDDQPRIMRGPCDPIAGMHGAFSLMVALTERDRTGVGVLVESPMIEAALGCAAEQIVEASAYGAVMGRDGNRSPYAAPQGLYPCRDHGPGIGERWLAVSVDDDWRWGALCKAIDRLDWAADPELATLAGRRAAADRLDEGLAEWAATLDRDAAVAHLLDHGVPAGIVADPRVLSRHPQLAARGLYEEPVHPSLGPVTVPGLPYRLTGVDHWVHEPSPTLGQHTRAVLHRLLGLDDDALDRLEAAGVTGTRPKL
jgi:crotonobetainyl-CoA:carnitine CoA-transferase CaiB-like acyl-CoA transferase